MTRLQAWIDQLDQTDQDAILKAEFKVVTPMFLGGGTQDAESIRPPAIKGALRFWWRALNWSRCLQQTGCETQALQKLHDQEAILFGLAAKKDSNGVQTGGQGVFNLKVIQEVQMMKPDWSPSGGVQYLLGQGLWNYKTKLLRSALANGSNFNVEIHWNLGRLKTAASLLEMDISNIKHSLDDALLAFGLLGGLGSRARKGLGSVSITGLSGSQWSVPECRQSYTHVIQQLLKPSLSATVLPPFTALSAKSRLDISIEGTNAMELLEKIGVEMQMYRSWGMKGQVGDKTAEKNFPDDHDQALLVSQGTQPTKAPDRAVFGMPHNYFFSSTKGKVDVHVKKDAAGERRSSPLFIHPHLLPNGHIIAVQLLLPAVFYPGSNPMLEYKSKRIFTLPVADANWQVITRYMNRFKNKVTVFSPNEQGV